jgi:thiamine biosynthesis lipoprotein
MTISSHLLRSLLVVLVIGLLPSCSPSRVRQFDGQTMGTTYHVTYSSMEGPGEPEAAQAVESLLAEINQAISTYIDTSMISRINASRDTTEWHSVDAHFETVFLRSRAIYEDTGGAFNPAVGPLVSAWGFGPDGPQPTPDDATIKNLLKLISFEAFDLRVSPPAVQKHLAAARLDFNAIGEGYAVDAIGALLEKRGIRNYLVEIGGEVRARGRHPDGRDWQVAIAKPAGDALATPQIQQVISLQDSGLATSGNYRNYRIEDGKKISHILNPRTGYPEESSLLSVSVIARDTMTADAYATSLMVMGLDEALRFVEARGQLKAYFIAKDLAGNLIEKWSSGFPGR